VHTPRFFNAAHQAGILPNGEKEKTMATNVKTCESCGMLMPKAKDHGGGEVGNPYCVHCTDETGKLKSRAEIREGMINLYMSRMGKPREEAEKFADQQMKKLPAWTDE
jgi:hypothetical protein